MKNGFKATKITLHFEVSQLRDANNEVYGKK